MGSTGTDSVFPALPDPLPRYRARSAALFAAVAFVAPSTDIGSLRSQMSVTSAAGKDGHQFIFRHFVHEVVVVEIERKIAQLPRRWPATTVVQIMGTFREPIQ